MSIHKSFGIGKSGEIHIINMLRAVGIEANKNEDIETREFFDIVCSHEGKMFTCEVKYDIMSEKTGNIAIEVFNSKSKKPSGIFGTKADLWFHLLPDGEHTVVCMCSTKKIREYSREAAPYKILKSVGDNNADILLYKVDDVLANLFVRIDNMANEKILTNIRKVLK